MPDVPAPAFRGSCTLQSQMLVTYLLSSCTQLFIGSQFFTTLAAFGQGGKVCLNGVGKGTVPNSLLNLVTVWAAASLSPERYCERASISNETSRRVREKLLHMVELFNAVQVVLALKGGKCAIKSDESSVSALTWVNCSRQIRRQRTRIKRVG